MSGPVARGPGIAPFEHGRPELAAPRSLELPVRTDSQRAEHHAGIEREARERPGREAPRRFRGVDEPREPPKIRNRIGMRRGTGRDEALRRFREASEHAPRRGHAASVRLTQGVQERRRAAGGCADGGFPGSALGFATGHGEPPVAQAKRRRQPRGRTRVGSDDCRELRVREHACPRGLVELREREVDEPHARVGQHRSDDVSLLGVGEEAQLPGLLAAGERHIHPSPAGRLEKPRDARAPAVALEVRLVEAPDCGCEQQRARERGIQPELPFQLRAACRQAYDRPASVLGGRVERTTGNQQAGDETARYPRRQPHQSSVCVVARHVSTGGARR